MSDPRLLNAMERSARTQHQANVIATASNKINTAANRIAYARLLNDLGRKVPEGLLCSIAADVLEPESAGD